MAWLSARTRSIDPCNEAGTRRRSTFTAIEPDVMAELFGPHCAYYRELILVATPKASLSLQQPSWQSNRVWRYGDLTSHDPAHQATRH